MVLIAAGIVSTVVIWLLYALLAPVLFRPVR